MKTNREATHGGFQVIVGLRSSFNMNYALE